MFKRLKSFLYDDDIAPEVSTEKEEIEKELLEEKKKYEVSEEQLETNKPTTEPLKRQVMFIDETFEKKSETLSTESNIYYNDKEKKFKPSKFISPVHGLLKDAEEVEVEEFEKKTISEKDYTVIRDKAFNKKTTVEEEVKLDDDSASSFKIFKTAEIVNLKKRLQLDDDNIVDDKISLEEAYEKYNENETVSNKASVDENSSQDLFDLLEELGNKNA